MYVSTKSQSHKKPTLEILGTKQSAGRENKGSNPVKC